MEANWEIILGKIDVCLYHSTDDRTRVPKLIDITLKLN